MCFALGKTYSSKVNNETISFVEAGPSQRDFCGSYNSPALDMQKPLGTQIISNNMIKSRGNTTCLNKNKAARFISAWFLQTYLFAIDEELAGGKNSLCSKRQAKIIYCLTVLTTEQTNMGNAAAAAELSGVNLYLREHMSPCIKRIQMNGERESTRTGFTALSCIIQKMS